MGKEVTEPVKCLNCSSILGGSFCGSCGQKAGTGRLSLKSLVSGVARDVAGLDYSVIRTTMALIKNPGQFVLDYKNGKRAGYWNPFRFFLFSIALNIASAFVLGEPAVTPVRASADTWIGSLSQTLQYGIVLSLLLLPIAAMLGFLFRKQNYNTTEAYCFLMYITSKMILYVIVLKLFISLFSTTSPLMNDDLIVEGLVVVGILSFLTLWGAYHFFPKPYPKTLMKLIASVAFALLLLQGVAGIILWVMETLVT